MAYSDRAASVYDNNRTTVRPTDQFKLVFNQADEIQINKARIEIRHSYAQLKELCDLQEITYAEGVRLKQPLAELLAKKHQDEENERAARLMDDEVDTDNEELNEMASIALA